MTIRTPWARLGFRRSPKPTAHDIVIFTRQMATMLDAGLPLTNTLTILAQQSSNPSLTIILHRLVADIRNGVSLANAMRTYPNVFTPLYVNMISAGETGSILNIVLHRLADALERHDALTRRVKGAMLYPIVICMTATLAVIALLIFVIPTFQSMFSSAGLTLPLPTQIVIALSGGVQRYWWALAACAAATVFYAKHLYATPSGHLTIDKLLLALPLAGSLIRKSAVARVTRTMGTLVTSGVPMLESLDLTARTAGNLVIQNALFTSKQDIIAGESIATPLQRANIFPPMVISMIHTGEQTGTLDQMLLKIGDIYDTEVHNAVSNLLTLIEPIMIVTLGVLIGGIIVAMYLPVFDMMNAVQ